MKYTVYVLYSKKYNKIYIGYTSNMEQRFLSHNKLAKKDLISFLENLKNLRPWVIAIMEEYTDKESAMKREKELKVGKGREWIWNELKERGLISA